jgi:agmatinase
LGGRHAGRTRRASGAARATITQSKENVVSTLVNFGGVASRSAGQAGDSRIVIVQAPYEGTVSYGGGTSKGPKAILDASLQVETRDEETGVDLETLAYSLGPVVEGEGILAEEYAQRVDDAVRPIALDKRIPFVLGGEHSVTIGAVRAVRALVPDAHVLSIDAHADLRNEYGGTTYSHACVCRRLLESGPVTIVGVRSYSAEEAEFAAQAEGLQLISAHDVLSGKTSAKKIASSLGKRVYVTVDVDGLDPSIMPATGTPEPGGLRWWDVLEILRRVMKKREIVGMDLVELAPIPGNRVSDFAAARLAAKMITYASMK